MKPSRFIDEASSPAEQVIALAASVEARPLGAGGWDEVLSRAVLARPSNAGLVPLFLLSVALGVGLVLLFQPAPVTRVAPVVHATAESRWSSVSAEEVRLESGRLSVTTPSATPLRVRTPDAVLEVTRSRFLAEVVAGSTTLWVEEGEVVLRAGDVVRVVKAGESITWPPIVAIPAPLSVPAPAIDSPCASLAPAEIRPCLLREASGASLEAQAALYELGSFDVQHGQLDSGLGSWRESLTRFPDGVLEPEVRLAMLIALVKARRYSESLEAARNFEAQCAGDPRVGDVQSLRRALEAQ